jgi:hypothetical protein
MERFYEAACGRGLTARELTVGRVDERDERFASGQRICLEPPEVWDALGDHHTIFGQSGREHVFVRAPSSRR